MSTDNTNHLNPDFICIVEDKSVGLLGYVVIDRTVNNRSCGGLRMHSKMNIDELKGLARGMTLKYGFTQTAQGGAKAGIVADLNTESSIKKELLIRFGQLIKPLLETNYYITGPDIGTTQSMINDMLRNLNLNIPRRRRNSGHNSGFFTALSVLVATEAASDVINLKLAKKTVAIEGFGSVGSSYALLMAKRYDAKLVAISTEKGAIYNKNGLIIDKLMELKKLHGDDLVKRYKEAEELPIKELLTLNVDILSQCGGPYTINEENVNSIQARIIVPGANIAITREAEEILAKRNIISIPFFTANYGGVLGNKIEITGVDHNFIEQYFRKKFKKQIINLVQESIRLNKIPSEIAEKYSINNFQTIQKMMQKRSIKNRVSRVAIQLFNNGLIPEMITKRIAPIYFK